MYIADDHPRNADHFLDRLHGAALRLADFHEIGTERPELGEGIHSFPVERYVLYYRPNGDGSIELGRVLRGSRDVTLIF
ncbi:MAG: type II toxin-antitoxin system RelE/ParE family toxin [Nitrosospira sp.]|nr:type II toxin-antitoxin system RelE/ParE family toxin [Nitrosospira sp.]